METGTVTSEAPAAASTASKALKSLKMPQIDNLGWWLFIAAFAFVAYCVQWDKAHGGKQEAVHYFRNGGGER